MIETGIVYISENAIENKWSIERITFKKTYRKYPPCVFCQHWATNVAQRAVTVNNITTTTAEIGYYGITNKFSVHWVAIGGK